MGPGAGGAPSPNPKIATLARHSTHVRATAVYLHNIIQSGDSLHVHVAHSAVVVQCSDSRVQPFIPLISVLFRFRLFLHASLRQSERLRSVRVSGSFNSQ